MVFFQTCCCDATADSYLKKKKKSTDGFMDGVADQFISESPGVSVTKIYFGSRTHSQLSQVIKELKRTSYRPIMAVLGSRDHYCINEHSKLSIVSLFSFSLGPFHDCCFQRCFPSLSISCLF